MSQNEEITAKFLNDKEFQEMVRKYLQKEVYKQIRKEPDPVASPTETHE
jgi:hypothetical protein